MNGRRSTTETERLPQNNLPEMRWYRYSIDDILSHLNSSRSGLGENEALSRLEEFGANEVSFKKEESPIHQFLKQFTSPLIYVLIAAGIVTFFLREWADTSVILGVVLANAIIGFIQERKSQHALESLAKMIVLEAVVLRGERRRVVPSREVVVGDVVILDSGGRVPADMRLFYVKNLRVDESALTGESMPVEKTGDVIEGDDLPIGDQRNMAFAGTLITQGQGMGVVVATAAETEIGKISGFIEKTTKFSTPLLQKLEVFGKQLSLIIVSVSLFTFLWGIAQDYDPVFIFLVAVGLAVAAIPESLPAAITITLAIGVKKMADRNAIIRNLPSVETLGSTTLICTDKTGTLTKNQMTVTSVYAGGKSYRVTGTGYEPSGSFFSGEREVDPLSDETLALLLEAGALCNDSAMREDGYGIEGDPTEGALLVSALKAGTRLDLPRLDVIPFEPENQYMATLHRLNDHENIIYVKGSPERILSFSKRSQGKDSLDSEEITGAADEMTTQALRVLAVSYKKVDSEKNRITPDDMRDLVFLGLVGMIDPPRDEVIDAIKTCKRAGIRVIMITGDHEKTALAIAEKVGIETQGALTGSKLDEIEDSELEAILTDISVFARTSPEHKLKIVQHLQKRGEVVAVTGDGINDAPALRTADIGIAMGITGTEVSREAADMILADDNFASIVAAVEEGRDVYGKISKIILWTLPTNGGEGLSMMAALLLGLTLPLLPLHILWINTVTAIGLGTTLIAEPKERDLLNRPPRPASEPLLQPLIKKLVILVSVLMVTGALTLFLINLEDEGVDVARTITINTIVLFEIFYLLNSKSIDEHVFKRLLRNKFMLLGVTIVVLLQMLITYHPMMNTIFHTAPLEPAKWPAIILVASSVFFIIELAKEARKRNSLKKFLTVLTV